MSNDQHELLVAAFEPIKHWYDGGGDHPEPPFHEMLKMAVEDLQNDRRDVLKMSKHLRDECFCDQTTVCAHCKLLKHLGSLRKISARINSM